MTGQMRLVLQWAHRHSTQHERCPQQEAGAQKIPHDALPPLMSSEGQIEHDTDDKRVEQAPNVNEARQRAQRLIPRRDFSFNKVASRFGASGSFHGTIRIPETSSSDKEEVEIPRTSNVLVSTMSRATLEAPQQ